VPKQPLKSIFHNPKMELCRGIDIAGVAAFVSSLPLPLQQASMTHIDALADVARKGNLGEHPGMLYTNLLRSRGAKGIFIECVEEFFSMRLWYLTPFFFCGF